MNPAYSLHTPRAYSQHTHSILTAYSQHTHSILTAYSQHTHSIREYSSHTPRILSAYESNLRILHAYFYSTRVRSAYSTHTPRRAPSCTHTLRTLPRYVRPVQHAIGAFSPHTYARLKRKTHLSARRALIPSSSRRQCAVNCSGVPQLNGRFRSASPLRRKKRRFVAITRTGSVHDGRCPLYSSKAFEYTLSVYAVSCRRSLLRTLYFAQKKTLMPCC